MNVCFVALHALPAIRPSADRPVGGSETRAWTFARALAAQPGTQVSFVVRGEQVTEESSEAGVRILRRPDALYSLYESVGHCLERRSEFPWLRLRRWSNSLIWQVPFLVFCRQFDRIRRDNLLPDPFFERLAADVFCTFGVQGNSARVIASAHAVGKPAVLMIGSDGDLDERFFAGSTYVSPYGDSGTVGRFILENADSIVVQTPRQQRLLNDRFGRAGTVIANPFDLPDWEEKTSEELPTEFRAGLERYALWIGRAEVLHKRPQVLLEVARRCQDVDFLMILNRRDPAVERRICNELPENVHVVPVVPYGLMPALFSRAAVFVSTSALEGFPNVFLQAAASGAPIVTLDVGEEFIAASGCGEFCGGNLERLAASITRVWQGEELDGYRCQRCRDYVAEHHNLDRQLERLRHVLESQTTTTACE